MEEVPKLDEINEQLDNGQQPSPVTVRTFLGWFEVYRRGWYVVQQINEWLDYYQIETDPYFDSVYIDSLIYFRRKRAVIDEDQAATSSTSTTTSTTVVPDSPILPDNDDSLNLNDPTYRIAKLEAANKNLISVFPDSELKEAITKMMTYDFSQLPVMQQPKRGLKGVISWRSIGTNLFAGQHSTKVRDLMETSIPLVASDTSLFKALPIIIEHDYVLVENSINEITGIVTASDLSLQFKQLTEPFLVVSEIENHVRFLLAKLPPEDIGRAKDEKDADRVIKSVADLTIGEHLRLFQNPDIWDKLGLPIDRKTFCDHLEKIRDIRNDIMHFDPDGLDEESIETLRRFARLLQTLKSIKAI